MGLVLNLVVAGGEGQVKSQAGLANGIRRRGNRISNSLLEDVGHRIAQQVDVNRRDQGFYIAS